MKMVDIPPYGRYPVTGERIESRKCQCRTIFLRFTRNDEVTVTPFVFLDEYKIAKICALKDSCAKIEGVKGGVREVNGPE